MNVTIMRLRPLTEEVSRLAAATERVADALETYLNETLARGYARPTPNLPKEEREVEVTYTSEEQDFERELRDALGKTPED